MHQLRRDRDKACIGRAAFVRVVSRGGIVVRSRVAVRVHLAARVHLAVRVHPRTRQRRLEVDRLGELRDRGAVGARESDLDGEAERGVHPRDVGACDARARVDELREREVAGIGGAACERAGDPREARSVVGEVGIERGGAKCARVQVGDRSVGEHADRLSGAESERMADARGHADGGHAAHRVDAADVGVGLARCEPARSVAGHDDQAEQALRAAQDPCAQLGMRGGRGRARFGMRRSGHGAENPRSAASIKTQDARLTLVQSIGTAVAPGPRGARATEAR